MTSSAPRPASSSATRPATGTTAPYRLARQGFPLVVALAITACSPGAEGDDTPSPLEPRAPAVAGIRATPELTALLADVESRLLPALDGRTRSAVAPALARFGSALSARRRAAADAALADAYRALAPGGTPDAPPADGAAPSAAELADVAAVRLVLDVASRALVEAAVHP